MSSLFGRNTKSYSLHSFYVLEYTLHRQLLNLGYMLTLMHKYSLIKGKHASYVFLKLEVNSVHKDQVALNCMFM